MDEDYIENDTDEYLEYLFEEDDRRHEDYVFDEIIKKNKGV